MLKAKCLYQIDAARSLVVFLPFCFEDAVYVACGRTRLLPSVLWRCWLGGRKGIRPVKTEWWGVGVVICLERGADFHMAQLMPLSLTVSCSSKIQIGFTFLVPAHLGGPGERAVKRVCVCVCGRTRLVTSSCCFSASRLQFMTAFILSDEPAL